MTALAFHSSGLRSIATSTGVLSFLLLYSSPKAFPQELRFRLSPKTNL